MIRPPRRSVTRFFIPLIDVLILLFCIFLLMPIVEEGASGPGGDAKLTAGEAQVLRQRLDQLQRRVVELEQTRESPRMRELQEEVEKLRQEASRSASERAAIRLFEIDGKTGALVYYDPERLVVRDQAEAERLADRDLRAAREAGLDLIYLILYPRRTGGEALFHPTAEERSKIDGWFSRRQQDGLRVRWETMRGLGRGKKP
jgi:hypothetical protein